MTEQSLALATKPIRAENFPRMARINANFRGESLIRPAFTRAHHPVTWFSLGISSALIRVIRGPHLRNSACHNTVGGALCPDFGPTRAERHSESGRKAPPTVRFFPSGAARVLGSGAASFRLCRERFPPAGDAGCSGSRFRSRWERIRFLAANSAAITFTCGRVKIKRRPA
jgi:hypothetical protein